MGYGNINAIPYCFYLRKIMVSIIGSSTQKSGRKRAYEIASALINRKAVIPL